jgi:hypothetical protein
MTTRVMCSFCHEFNTVTATPTYCSHCGHRADTCRLDCDCGQPGCKKPADAPRANYWTVEEAAGDVDQRKCVHGVPLNVFCGRCES